MNFIHGQLTSSQNRPGSIIAAQTSNAPSSNSSLPLSNLESLRFKANQIIDSIQALQHMIEQRASQNAMPAWPDLLTKYNILLSQTHSFSVGLAGITGGPGAAPGSQSSGNMPGLGGRTGNAPLNGAGGPAGVTTNILEKIVLHPSVSMPDTQLETEVIPLLRNQQTNDVLRAENETVRRLAEHMATRGSVGVLAPQCSSNAAQAPNFGSGFGSREKKPVEYEDVLQECEQIRDEHDRRVDRAIRAVAMLREKFEWKQRVEVEVEEPEELEWDPRAQGEVGRKDRGAEMEGEGGDDMDEDDESDVEGKGEGDSSPEAGGGTKSGDTHMDEEGSDGDENEVQAMVDSEMETQTPPTGGGSGQNGNNNMVVDVEDM